VALASTSMRTRSQPHHNRCRFTVSSARSRSYERGVYWANSPLRGGLPAFLRISVSTSSAPRLGHHDDRRGVTGCEFRDASDSPSCSQLTRPRLVVADEPRIPKCQQGGLVAVAMNTLSFATNT
jgi:hypothetical protein